MSTCPASRLATVADDIWERIAGRALVFFLQVVREKGGSCTIELSHPFLFSTEFVQEAVHISDNCVLPPWRLGELLESTEMRCQLPVASHP